MRYRYIESPVGPILLAADEAGLRRIVFAEEDQPAAPGPDWVEDRIFLEQPARQLGDYFERGLKRFDLCLNPVGTPFQIDVWNALAEIPYGRTITYQQLAHSIGRPKACRAVGAANGRNPLPIVLPCHRVIGSDGSLTGYGGGLHVKEALLRLERGQMTFF
jgi:methylated-DNA-[protein]-cysteine S-methyltransferase